MVEDREVTVARGVRAQALLEDELLNDAFKALEEQYIAYWRGTRIEDSAAREKLFVAINVVGKVKDHLATVASDGKLAAAELRAAFEEAERKKLFGIL